MGFAKTEGKTEQEERPGAGSFSSGTRVPKQVPQGNVKNVG